jgi:hypothetical protein
MPVTAVPQPKFRIEGGEDLYKAALKGRTLHVYPSDSGPSHHRPSTANAY